MLRSVVQMDEKTLVDESLSAQPPPPPDATPVSPLTREARVLVEEADQGGVPLYTTANLARLAEENGVAVSSATTPNSIIEALRQRMEPRDS